jgi:S1-C subfamily serine protease
MALVSCENENGFFGEKINVSDNKNQSESRNKSNQDNNSIKENEESYSEEDIPDLLLKTSVSISNYSNGIELNTGSGAFISTNLVVTNYHVIEGGDHIELTRNSDNKKFTGKLKKIDEVHDVCLIEIEEVVNEFLKLNDQFPKIGDDIMVAGSPIGFNGTITKGNVSNIQKKEPFDYEVLQISAPMSPGNSGGPVVNLKGELIGISVGSMIGIDIQNINFAIPSKYVMLLLKE